MKIIEAKCPGCGANVKFDENSKSGVCEYCKKEFVIEKDPKEEYLLTLAEFQKSVFKRVSIMQIVIPIIALIIMGIIIFTFIHGGILHNDNTSSKLSSIENISGSDYSYIDNHANIAIRSLTFGDNDFVQKGNILRVKEYLLVGEKDSIFVPIYKTTYTDFLYEENKITIYIPVKFDNVLTKNNRLDIISLGDGVIDCEEYYFNLEHSSYSKGYQSIDDVYSKYIKPMEKDYKVIKK